MHLKSMYPDPPPNPSMLNAYSVLAGRSGVADWPDFTAHVEYHTGKKYSFKEVCARINYLATALGAPTSLEGLGLEAGSGERIGIMSDNSSVGCRCFRMSSIRCIALFPFDRTMRFLSFLSSRSRSRLYQSRAMRHPLSCDIFSLLLKSLGCLSRLNLCLEFSRSLPSLGFQIMRSISSMKTFPDKYLSSLS